MTRAPHPLQDELLDRILDALPPGTDVRVVAMFGGRAVMLEDAMLVSAGKDGSLLVRCDPARHAELLTRPGARQAVMGRDRSMGEGWLEVDAGSLEADTALTSWLEVALAFHDR
ncbi:TfoX/Sxy family protein [Brachybacterium sp. YJGR34]|uniref:TfoX/Sxy family protein n=1 Tax=Brachybacterium sp. YJGR34 TaxID=2059911 RepID=UPI000E0BC169|nr:TfoX/Sxy family protein [Brachybacterium sp. YJGR34]